MWRPSRTLTAERKLRKEELRCAGVLLAVWSVLESCCGGGVGRRGPRDFSGQLVWEFSV